MGMRDFSGVIKKSKNWNVVIVAKLHTFTLKIIELYPKNEQILW